MGDSFAPVVVRRSGRVGPVRQTAEARQWSSLKSVVSEVLPSPVTKVSFSPRAPYEMAAASGLAVSLIDAQAGQVRRTLGRFKDVAHSPSFKPDGRLLVAGSENGVTQVFDLSSRAVLRLFKGHTGAVRSSRFTSDGLRVMTGSDDTTVRTWDLATSRCLFSLTDAKDYVRAQAPSPSSKHVWMVGSSDRKARLYDLRTQKCLFTLDHGYQVDDVLILPGGARAVTIGGAEAKVWDFFAGGRLVSRLGSHAKAVTCGAIDTVGQRLLTGGLDGQVKVHDLTTYETTAALAYGSQILAVAVSPDGQRVGVGMVDGTADIRARKGFADDLPATEPVGGLKERQFEGWGRGFEKEKTKPRGPRPGTMRYYMRGGGESVVDDRDVVVGKQGKSNLKPYDKLLQKFAYGKALDTALETKTASIGVSVIEELILRSALEGALAGRDQESLVPILALIRKNIRNPLYTVRLTQLSNVILDMYGGEFGHGSEADKLLTGILTCVHEERLVCRQLSLMQGAIESIMAAAEIG